eukprot:363435-Chlamydomonas_euryale.AAC.6
MHRRANVAHQHKPVADRARRVGRAAGRAADVARHIAAAAAAAVLGEEAKRRGEARLRERVEKVQARLCAEGSTWRRKALEAVLAGLQRTTRALSRHVRRPCVLLLTRHRGSVVWGELPQAPCGLLRNMGGQGGGAGWVRSVAPVVAPQQLAPAGHARRLAERSVLPTALQAAAPHQSINRAQRPATR